MLRKRRGLPGILLVLSILLLLPFGLIGAGSHTRSEAPLPEPDITHLQGSGLEPAEPEDHPLLGQGSFPCKKVLLLDDRDGSGFSVLKSDLAGLGFEVQELLPTEITAALIAPYDVVVFSLGWYAGGGGQRELNDAEAAALVHYVNSGKSLFLIGELGRAGWSGTWRRSLNRIAGNFGITFGNNLLCSPASHLNDPSDPDGGIDLPIITDIRSNLLGEGVGQFSLFWGAALGVKSPARAVARSDAGGWKDIDCTWNYVINEWECEQDPYEPSGAQPVLAVAESGSGRIMAIGDSSWMLNGWIDYTNNRQLAKNAFTWLARIPSVKTFTAQPVYGRAPLPVAFTCKTKDAGTHVQEVLWDLGNGTTYTSTTDNNTAVFYHTFHTAGTYTASCTVVDTSSCSSTSKPTTVTVAPNRPPVIDAFTADNQTGIQSLLVHFTCTAHDPDPRGSVASYRFTFGDGNSTSNTTGRAAHRYGIGTFNATCAATDNVGARRTSSPLTITVVPNQAPVINSFTADNQTGIDSLLVHFTCSARDPDGAISRYQINFGDGNSTSSTTGSASHRYGVGAFNATCTAVDNLGAQTASSPLPITVVANQAPVISSFSADNQTGIDSLLVNFTCNARDRDGTISYYLFNFGDGNSTSSTTGSTTHLYGVGAFNATCTAVDNLGARTASSPLPITVAANQAPVIDSFTADNQTGIDSLLVNFTCSAHDPDGTISYYAFNFGDGNTTSSTTGDATHRYGVGAFNATCTAVDNLGAQTASPAIPITVAANEAPMIHSFTATPQDLYVPVTVDFFCSAIDSDGTISYYSIDFGDGNTTISVTGSASKTYYVTGTFNATCTAVDNLGASSSPSSQSISIDSITLPLLTNSETSSCTDSSLPVYSYSFTCTAPPGTSPSLYQFEFGDNNTGSYDSNATSYTIDFYDYSLVCPPGDRRTPRCIVSGTYNGEPYTLASEATEVQIHPCEEVPAGVTPPQITSFTGNETSTCNPHGETFVYHFTCTTSAGSVPILEYDFILPSSDQYQIVLTSELSASTDLWFWWDDSCPEASRNAVCRVLYQIGETTYSTTAVIAVPVHNCGTPVP